MQSLCNLSADLPHADDADRLILQIGYRRSIRIVADPAPLLQVRMCTRDVAALAQDHSDGEVGDGGRIASRGMVNSDAFLRRIWHIHIFVPAAQYADEAELRAGIKNFFRDRAELRNENLRIAQLVNEAIRHVIDLAALCLHLQIDPLQFLIVPQRPVNHLDLHALFPIAGKPGLNVRRRYQEVADSNELHRRSISFIFRSTRPA